MRCKIVTVLIVSVVMSFVCGRMLFAQYTGGNGDGYAMGSFTGILYDRPSVTTGSATSVTTSSAILNGTVSTNGTTTTALFQYGALPVAHIQAHQHRRPSPDQAHRQ